MKEIVELMVSLVNKGIINKNVLLYILKTVFTVLCTLIGVYYITPAALDHHNLKMNERHSKLMDYRNIISPKIDSVLNVLRESTDSDRAFVGEYSNSTVGLNSIAFLYFTIHNEKVRPGVTPISKQYQKQNNSNFKLNTILYEQNVFVVDSLEQIRESDPLSYLMFKHNGVKQAVFYMIRARNEAGIEIPVGFVGVTYLNSEKRNSNYILYRLSQSAGAIASYFEGANKIR